MSEPAGSRRERRTQGARRAEAERRLLDAAAELVGEVGPAGVTLASIGERAGYSRGLATHYFGSKGALMARLVDHVTNRFADEVLVVDETMPPAEQLARLADLYLGATSSAPSLHRARVALWAEAAANSPDIKPAMARADEFFRGELVRRVSAARQAGRVPEDVDADALAMIVVGLLRGVLLQAMIDDRLGLESVQQEIARLVEARFAGPAAP